MDRALRIILLFTIMLLAAFYVARLYDKMMCIAWRQVPQQTECWGIGAFEMVCEPMRECVRR